MTRVGPIVLSIALVALMLLAGCSRGGNSFPQVRIPTPTVPSRIVGTHASGTITLTLSPSASPKGPATASVAAPSSPTKAPPPSSSSSPASSPSPTPTPIAGPLTVTATVSDATPCQYATVTILVHVEDARDVVVSAASVASAWHYKTTTSYEYGTTDAGGDAELSRGISRATAGYTVVVDVSATKNSAHGSTTTSFTPQDC